MLVVNKMDRLILELKLPPQDAYFKVRQVIEEANATIAAASAGERAPPPLSAEDGAPETTRDHPRSPETTRE